MILRVSQIFGSIIHLEDLRSDLLVDYSFDNVNGPFKQIYHLGQIHIAPEKNIEQLILDFITVFYG